MEKTSLLNHPLFLRARALLDAIPTPQPGATADALIRITAISFLIALALSWKLWFHDRPYLLPYPMLSLGVLPGWAELGMLWAVISATVVVLCAPRLRWLCLVPAAALLFWTLQDALRLQPFLYMYFFIFTVCGFLPRDVSRDDLNALRYMTVGIYFWAGLHKVNAVFIFGVFPWFVSSWTDHLQVAALFGFFVPFLEMSIAFMLFVPKWRRYGVLMAFVMLSVVLFSLVNHGWGMIVWPWNLCIFAAAFLLFWKHQGKLDRAALKRHKLSIVAVLLFLLLPSLGLFGILGDGLAFRLYCGCSPMSKIHLSPREDLSFLPPNLRKYDAAEGVDGTLLTHSVYRIAATSAIGYTDMYRHSLRGLCPLLSYPEEARLEIRRYRNIWSIEQDSETFPLCAPPEVAP